MSFTFGYQMGPGNRIASKLNVPAPGYFSRIIRTQDCIHHKLCGNKIERTGLMYQQFINTPDQALVHLAFHCCLKDGKMDEAELDFLAGSFAAKGLNKELDMKAEMMHYRSYFGNIQDEVSFLHFLVEKISPRARLALFAFCAEIICRDGNIAISEEVLLNKIAGILNIKDSENLTIQNLITEMNAVEKRNAF